MRVCCFGSLNIDNVFSVNDFVRPKETISSTKVEVFPGGKGLNQAVALAKAGADVYMAGAVGKDGQILLDTCDQYNLNRTLVQVTEGYSGAAFIQVNQVGENCIVLSAGANHEIDKEYIDKVLSNFDKGDILLIQNEINNIHYIIEKAVTKKMIIAFNPSPFNELINTYQLDLIDYFILNEVEGGELTNVDEHSEILESLINKFPKANIILTLGEKGVYFGNKDTVIKQEAKRVKAVDSTGAGDTFTGYFLASISKGEAIESALYKASVAAAIAVTRKGATSSIPSLEEVSCYKQSNE